MKNNKKGFTLAELLIVVAIIAVLVAIAVPIFVGALEKAEKATLEANERTLRGIAVAEILADDDLLYQKDSTETYKYWYVSATYTKETKDEAGNTVSGGFGNSITITPAVDQTKQPTTWGKSEKKGDKYNLFIIVTATQVTAAKGELNDGN